MALFRTVPWSEPLPVIEGAGVVLRPPLMADFAEWCELRRRSRDFLMPWEPIWPVDDLTRGAFRRRLRRYARDLREDQAYPLLIFRASDRVMVGGLTLSNVRRGVAQAGSLGYWMGAAYAGQGYMSAAVAALLPYAHGELRLKRVEAACMPHNLTSTRLLEKLGFVREGYARQYLCIGGVWQDHLLYARLASDPMPVVETPEGAAAR